VLPVDLVECGLVRLLGVGRCAGNEVLLDEHDEGGADLPSVHVRQAQDVGEALAAEAREHGKDALCEVRRCARARIRGHSYRRKFAVDLFDQEGAELRQYLCHVGYGS
jgi:hypothetical protein